MYDREALDWIDCHGGILALSEDEPHMKRLQESVTSPDDLARKRGIREKYKQRNAIIDRYIALGVKNGWSKAETLYWLNKSGSLRENVTFAQIDRQISYSNVKLTRKFMAFNKIDQEHVDKIVLQQTNHGKSSDQIAMMINDLGYGTFVDAPYVTHRYRKLIPKSSYKSVPELTGEEKRIVDVQITVTMNTGMNADDLVQYLNGLPKIKHEVTRDVVIKRAKRMHIKLEGDK